MTTRPASSTLLVFTLAPGRERERKRLLPTRMAAVELEMHRRGLEATVEAGRKCGCRVAVSTPSAELLRPGIEQISQSGQTFGERFLGAIRRARRDAPAVPLLVVGTDVPGLGRRHVAAALSALEKDPESVVVGPSPDGGFYLLASLAPLDSTLESVRWCTRHTLSDLLSALGAAGISFELLPQLSDLDDREDVETWLATRVRLHDVWDGLRRHLIRLFAALRKPAAPQTVGRRLPALVPIRAGRAPPG